MQSLISFVGRLRADVQARCGCSVKSVAYNKAEYVLRKFKASGKGNFAYISRTVNGQVVPNKCFKIQVKDKYAIKAGVAHLKDSHDNNGYHGAPAIYYWVLNGNRQSYNKAVKALSEICRVR